MGVGSVTPIHTVLHHTCHHTHTYARLCARLPPIPYRFAAHATTHVHGWPLPACRACHFMPYRYAFTHDLLAAYVRHTRGYLPLTACRLFYLPRIVCLLHSITTCFGNTFYKRRGVCLVCTRTNATYAPGSCSNALVALLPVRLRITWIPLFGSPAAFASTCLLPLLFCDRCRSAAT